MPEYHQIIQVTREKSSKIQILLHVNIPFLPPSNSFENILEFLLVAVVSNLTNNQQSPNQILHFYFTSVLFQCCSKEHFTFSQWAACLDPPEALIY